MSWSRRPRQTLPPGAEHSPERRGDVGAGGRRQAIARAKRRQGAPAAVVRKTATVLVTQLSAEGERPRDRAPVNRDRARSR